MKISLRWINEFVDVGEYFERPDQLAQLLTAAGLEVEEMVDLAQQYKHVQIGLILEKEKHPDADKLSVCKVTTGEGVVHQIVCGAKNHKLHDRVIVALPGALLPGNFAISNSVLRGVASGGMLCSYKELGLADTSEGIAILPEEAPLGLAFAEYAGLNDILFELKVTPNRADCLSHIGLAREIGCLLNRTFHAKAAHKQEIFDQGMGLTIEVLDPDLCPRYTGRILRNIKVGPSPVWLKKRIEAVGMKSINNVVDVTNYVMMEWGQPLHAFDMRSIQGNSLRIGKAQPHEKFVTLDGTELTLVGEELMIRDGQRSLCMGGVVGGKNSGVQEDTQEIFLESAYFAPQVVRRGARAHGINTDSGYRFSRGVDPTSTLEALDRATELLVEVAGALVASKTYEIKNRDWTSRAIAIHPQTISDRLGYAVDIEKFESWMQRLGCRLEKINSVYSVCPPSWRVDLEMDMDLVEEYARLNGYEHIPETLPALGAPPTLHDRAFEFQTQLVEWMTALGYSQALNFAFVGNQRQVEFLGSQDLLAHTGLSNPRQSIQILNPLNDQMDVLRISLSLGLYGNLVHNYHHGVEVGRLFEMGTVFDKDSGEYRESLRWAGIGWGWSQNLWTKNSETVVALDLKGAIEEVLSSLGYAEWIWLKASEVGGVPHFLHPGQSSILQLEGKKIGFLGTIHPQWRDASKIRVDAALFELDIDECVRRKRITKKISAISKFQVVERDVSLVMPKFVGVGLVQNKMLLLGKNHHLQSVSIFDLYEGEKLIEGHKSVTYRLRFQNIEATLTDSQVQEAVDFMVVSMKKHWEIQVR